MTDKPFDFDKAFKQIQNLSQSLQSDELSPGVAVSKYEEGMKLIKQCDDYLKETEVKFIEIKNKYNVDDMEENEEEEDDSSHANKPDPTEIPF